MCLTDWEQEEFLNGNYFSINLYHHLENEEEIHPEVDLKRFQ